MTNSNLATRSKNMNMASSFDGIFNTFFKDGKDLLGWDIFDSEPFPRFASSNYPPYDVIRKKEDDEYEIRFAVAGVGKDDIDVSVEDDVLTVKSETSNVEESEGEKHLYKGIANRSFRTSFRLPQHAEVEDCSLTNGILSITIKKEIPEDKLPKRIEIK